MSHDHVLTNHKFFAKTKVHFTVNRSPCISLQVVIPASMSKPNAKALKPKKNSFTPEEAKRRLETVSGPKPFSAVINLVKFALW